MTLAEIQARVMFQTNNDAEDVGDFTPHLPGYINDGYDRLLYAYDKKHLGEDPAPLADADDVPQLPLWTHAALADWATWMVYRNGNPQKQNRGFQFRAAFEEVLRQVISAGGRSGMEKRVSNFYNIP